MNNFVYYAPTEVHFGRGTENETGKLVKKYGGTKVLIHYGGGSAVRSGLISRVKKSLEESGIAYCELGGVVPNPHLSKVREGIELCKKEGVDFLLAVGGGSVADSCKAIGYGMLLDGDVWRVPPTPLSPTRRPGASAPTTAIWPGRNSRSATRNSR